MQIDVETKHPSVSKNGENTLNVEVCHEPPRAQSESQWEVSSGRVPGSDVWVIVPAYNEGGRLRASLEPLLQSTRFNVVVVDDGSADDTHAVAQTLPVWVLHHPFNCGQGAAIRTGIEFALSRGAKYLITFDADGQHASNEIDQLLQPLISGEVEVTLGTRFARGDSNSLGMPLRRRWLLRAAVVFTRLTTGLSLTDSHNGFRGLTRRAAQMIHIQQARMAHASEILDQVARHRLSYREVPVTIRYTEETLAKGQSSWDALRIGGQLLLERFAR